MIRYGHALGLERIEGTDDLELEGSTYPHCVGIDQFLDHVGAIVEPIIDAGYRGPAGIPAPLAP